VNRLGSLPNGRAFPACPADLFNAGMPLGRWQVPNDPEKQLEELLASIPAWMRRLFQNGYGALSESELAECTFDSGVQPLREKYEAILQGMPARWKEYCRRVDREVVANFSPSFRSRGKPGRKPNDELAERIWSLSDAGNTSREIQAALKNDGINLTVEGIESYRKTRRRPRKQ
jgi:hypothetical protein